MDLRKLKTLIDLVQNSGISELEISEGEEKIRIAKHAAPAAPTTVMLGSHGYAPQQAPLAAAVPIAAVEAAAPAEPDGHAVKAPMVGTFYRSSTPGGQSFVEVGQTVKAGDTLCIIEAMKLLNEIEAEVGGVVKEILVENDRAVGVRLANGETHRAGAVVSAGDGYLTHFGLLGGRYLDEKTRRRYAEKCRQIRDAARLLPPCLGGNAQCEVRDAFRREDARRRPRVHLVVQDAALRIIGRERPTDDRPGAERVGHRTRAPRVARARITGAVRAIPRSSASRRAAPPGSCRRPAPCPAARRPCRPPAARRD